MSALTPTEDHEQQALAEWLDIHRVAWFHVPNGEARTTRVNAQGQRYSPAGARLKKLGVKPGVPDIVIVDPPPAKPGKVGTVIELKRSKGGSATPEQKEWLRSFEARGWETLLCHGAQSAIDALVGLGYHKMRFAEEGAKR